MIHQQIARLGDFVTRYLAGSNASLVDYLVAVQRGQFVISNSLGAYARQAIKPLHLVNNHVDIYYTRIEHGIRLGESLDMTIKGDRASTELFFIDVKLIEWRDNKIPYEQPLALAHCQQAQMILVALKNQIHWNNIE